VAPNAISTNFMANQIDSMSFNEGVG
jgi:hypothetical protein